MRHTIFLASFFLFVASANSQQTCPQAVCILSPVFSGSGILDDASSGGTYTGVAANHIYTATICATGTPDAVAFTSDRGTTSGCSVAVSTMPTQMFFTAGSVSAASWLAGITTYTTSAPHQMQAGEYVTINGASPSAYNISGLRIVSVLTPTKFTVSVAVNPGTWTSGGTVYCGNGVTMSWAATTGHTNGSAWTVSTTVNGSINGQSFVQSGVGAVVVRNAQDKERDVISVLDFKDVDRTGVADSTAGIQAAIDAAKCGSVYFPAGTFLLTSTVTIGECNQMGVYGARGGTKFIWGGSNSTPEFIVQDCLQCEVKDLNFSLNSSNPVKYFIQLQNSGSGGPTASLDRFININMEGAAGYVTTCVYIGGGVNGNNDQQYFESVVCRNYSHSAFTLNNSQVYDVFFNHCGFASDGYGKYGVEALAGNFYFENGNGSSNWGADFYLAGGGGFQNRIIGGKYEGSAKFIDTAGPAYNLLDISVKNIYFSGDNLGCSQMQIQMGCPMPPGGDAITYKFAGALNLEDDFFGVSTSIPLTVSVQVFTPPAPTIFTCHNSTFLGPYTTAATVFPGAQPMNKDGVCFSYDGGATGTSIIPLVPGLAVAPVNLSAGTTIPVAGYPQGQLFLTPNSGTPSYDKVTGEYNGYYFFVACRNAAGCTFTANTFNIQFDGGISPLMVAYENTAQFICFSGVCTLITVAPAPTGITPGTYPSDPAHVAEVTFNAAGAATAVALVAIYTAAPGQLAVGGTSGGPIVGGDLSGEVTTAGGTVTTIANSGVTAGTYGDASHAIQLTLNAGGRATGATNVAIDGGQTGTVNITASCTFNAIPVTLSNLCQGSGTTVSSCTGSVTYPSTGSTVSCTITPGSMTFTGGFKQ